MNYEPDDPVWHRQKILKHVVLSDAHKRPSTGPSPDGVQIDHSEIQIIYCGNYSDPDYPFEAYL